MCEFNFVMIYEKEYNSIHMVPWFYSFARTIQCTAMHGVSKTLFFITPLTYSVIHAPCTTYYKQIYYIRYR